MEPKIKKTKNLNVLFITHSYTTGFSQMFFNFSKDQVETFIFIDHPLDPRFGTKTIVSVYKKGKLVREYSVPRIGRLWVLNYLLDTVISIVSGGFLIKTQTDLSIGANNLNTLALLVLKKLGKVKRVIYHTVDYTPYRFGNNFINNIYHVIDRICCYNCDMLWNSSARMNEGRVKNGVDKKRIAYSIVTPDGSNFDSRKMLPINKIDRRKLIFLGHMRPAMGIELILTSARDILKKVPDAKLVLIGGGPKLEEYKRLAKTLRLEDHVSFTGFVEKHEDVDDILCTGAIGLAPFAPDKTSYEYYSDVGKPKVYLAAGMPVVITKIPEIADIIDREKAGIGIEYKKNDLTNALVLLLTNDTMYRRFRENAIRLSKRYVWDQIFTKAYEDTLSYLK